MNMDPLWQFECYAEAVDADRYRVTSIKMREDGSKQTFILDKKDGVRTAKAVTRGFTPHEIAQRMPEMLRLQRRGENLYYTPLSDKKHHILIDDMDRTKLERLIQDGYQPAVVIESSLENYQAIITVPKLGTPQDKDVGNRLCHILNREYGDPKLSGAIHPHRAPGFENRKPRHQRADGSYPVVRLRKAKRRECAKTLSMSIKINADCQQEALKRAPNRIENKPAWDLGLEIAPSRNCAMDAYWNHYDDIIKRQRLKDLDLSRVDSMIAVRMRVTGHDQLAIEHAIRHCALAIRKQNKDGKNWDDYALRTARYAFSASGDRQVEQCAKYQKQWKKIENRKAKQMQEQNEQSDLASWL